MPDGRWGLDRNGFELVGRGIGDIVSRWRLGRNSFERVGRGFERVGRGFVNRNGART